jgi:capsular exopolysaccharide synthesis family protein
MDDPVIPESSEETSFATRFFNNLHHYRKLVFSYWWIIVLTTGIGLGIQFYLERHTALSFISYGRMIVSVKLSIPNANLYSEELNNFFDTQEALMQSDTVRNRVMARVEAANPPLNIVPVRISVDLASKTSIFNLSAVGSDPLYTQTYLQYTMEEYGSLKKDLLDQATLATKSSIEGELDSIGKALDASKKEVLNYQASNSIVFLGGNTAAERLAELTRKMEDDKLELHLLQTLTLDENLQRQQGIFAPQTGSPPPPAQSPPAQQPNSQTPANTGGQQNPSSDPSPNSAPAPTANNTGNLPSNLGDFETAYLQAKQQILQLINQRDEMAQFLRPKHPDMIVINQQITNQERMLEIYKGQSQDQLDNQKRILELTINTLTGQVADQRLKAVDASQKLAIYDALKADQGRLQAEYDQLQSTLQTVEADSGISQEGVGIFEPATPATALTPQKTKHLAMAGLVGFILGLGLVLFLDRLDDRPASYSEMKKLFDEPILGQIPLIKAKGKGGIPLLQWDDDRHRLVESFRNLRSAMIFKNSSEKQPKSIVITSAIPNDGKSLTAANLAITLARSGERVLLVDSDLRRGVLHKHFMTPSGPGLADVLAGNCVWTEAVLKSSIPNLHLLPCGAPQRQTGGLFVAHVEKFLKQIANGQYDYFLFDTAPIMATDDVSNLAPYMDGVLMVVRSGYTSARIAQAALDLLYLRRVKVMGLVFNAVRPNASEYYYYRYSEYYGERTK